MRTQRLAIQEISRTHPIGIVEPSDFVYQPSGEISTEEVFADPRFSLFCFDLDNNTALFVECADPEAVEKAPFYYQSQVENAVGLVSMPIEAFHQIAATVPEPENGIILVHSVGRCGSTLISKAFQAIPSVHSLSEPDDLTQLALLRGLGKATDESITQLFESSLKWRCKPRVGEPAKSVAIKTRSEVLVLADLLGPRTSHCKHLFLYRDAVAWMRTIFKGFSPERDVYDSDLNEKMETGWARMLPLVRGSRKEGQPMNPVQIRIMAWISCLESALKLQSLGIPLCPVRFEDLTAQPESILRQVFDFCALADVDFTKIQAVLERDSQAGTTYARELRKTQTRQLTPDLEQDIHHLLATRPMIQSHDFVVPGSLRP